MRIDARLNIQLNAAAVIDKAKKAVEKAQVVLDEQVLKDSNFYIPKDTGELERSGVRSSVIGKGSIVWDTPYARRLYYNPQYNFSKDSNPNAQGLWFEAAKASFLTDWVRITEQAYRRAYR